MYPKWERVLNAVWAAITIALIVKGVYKIGSTRPIEHVAILAIIWAGVVSFWMMLELHRMQKRIIDAVKRASAVTHDGYGTMPIDDVVVGDDGNITVIFDARAATPAPRRPVKMEK